MKTLYFFTLLLICTSYTDAEKDDLRQENKRLKETLEKVIKVNDTLRNEVDKWNNHVYRMQRIVGIKNPDSVFTWREKVINKIDIKNTIK